MNSTSQLHASEALDSFRAEVVLGLSRSPKRLSCKHFYDLRGSELFNQICELDEYYLTRVELAIMEQYAAQMGEQIGAGVRLVEFGSGASVKTRILLDNLPQPRAYVPVDISRQHLLEVSEELQAEYPRIEVLPVVADFTRPFSIPEPRRPATHTAVYFPGSTIGNFEVSQVESLLRHIASLCGEGGGLLIGIDLEKSRDVLELAYNDPLGVTAEFNLNLLHRLRNELAADLDLKGFEHHAFYNADLARIEIYIRSLADQTIGMDGAEFSLAEGELIHTEYSHKYTIGRFAAIAATAGLSLRMSWTDENEYFAVLHLVRTQGPA